MIKFICYPKCTTCQKAKKWLDDNKIEYELRDIKENNPTLEELSAWYKMSGLPLKKFFNTSGMLYREMKLSEKLPQMNVYGFDLSKEMVRLAAKRRNGACCFVANLSKIPLRDSSVDVAFHLFAPFHEKEFRRIIKDDGIIITAVAGENHLFELKKAVYDNPYYNDVPSADIDGFELEDEVVIKSEIILKSNEDIVNLFKMTPYYYKTSVTDQQKLENVQTLVTQAEFGIRVYRKD